MSTLREERLESRLAYDGKVVRLEVDRVRMPDGSETIREVVRHPGAAVVAPFLDGDRLLMVRQHRYPLGADLLELPAGKRDPGEAEETCARRELEEETGYRAGGLRLLGHVHTAPGFTDERIACFAATELEPVGEPSPDADEVLEVVAVPFVVALEAIRRGEITDAKTMVTVLLLAEER